jgi:hypothetical protein
MRSKESRPIHLLQYNRASHVQPRQAKLILETKMPFYKWLIGLQAVWLVEQLERVYY